jgi:hypothetical protein
MVTMYAKASQKEKVLDELSLQKKKKERDNSALPVAQVKSTFAAHDRTQLETVFDYPVVPGLMGASRKQKYEVEAWFFYPPQLGVTPQTYTKDRFYADLRPLVRFREPRFSFRDLIGLNGSRSPIKFLDDYVRQVAEGHPPATIQRAISEARIFGCSFASYFLKRMTKRTKAIRKAHRYIATVYDDQGKGVEHLEMCLEETRELLSKSLYLLKEWRRILSQAENLNQDYLTPLVTELKFVDEYCTYRIRDGLATLMRVATEIDPRLVPDLDYLAFLRRCVAMNRLERWYAKRRNYSWIDENSTDDEIEKYMYRRGLLKRRTWGVLYLNIRTRPLFEFQRQLGAMAAAGVAALWWVVAMYFITLRGGAFIGGNDMANPEFWRSSGFLIMTASMIAYVLKDRIKENGRNFFSGMIFRNVPDNSERILYEPATEAPVEVGSVKEYTRFVPSDDLPIAVREIRAQSFADDLEAEDAAKSIIHYKKVVELYPRAIALMDYPIRAVHDILRINIAGYLTRLDDPQAGTDVISVDGRLSSLKLPKVYQMHIVLRHSLQHRRDPQIVYDHFKLVLNKRGILRIERM